MKDTAESFDYGADFAAPAGLEKLCARALVASTALLALFAGAVLLDRQARYVRQPPMKVGVGSTRKHPATGLLDSASLDSTRTTSFPMSFEFIHQTLLFRQRNLPR